MTTNGFPPPGQLIRGKDGQTSPSLVDRGWLEAPTTTDFIRSPPFLMDFPRVSLSKSGKYE